MSAQMTLPLVADALLMAIWRRGLLKALLLTQHGITCSTSRSSNCWDTQSTLWTERPVYSTLKTERTSRKNYQSRGEARADVFDYIERFYNPRRRHSTLSDLSPADYEKMAHSG